MRHYTGGAAAALLITLGACAAPRTAPLAAPAPAQPVDTPPPSTGAPGPTYDDAARAYDRGEYATAKAVIVRLLPATPSDQRLLRMAAAIACIEGDEVTARSYVGRLDSTGDKQVMTERCRRYGITL